MKRYLVRALKQFVYLAVLLTLLVVILVKAGFVEGDLSTMFVNGYDSLWQIALIVAAFAAVYPRIGYSTREVRAPGPDDEVLPVLRSLMEERDYKLAGESADGQMKFIKRAPFARASRMWEDTVTVSRTLAGLSLEGRTKDIARLGSALEFKLNLPEEDA